MKNLLFIALIIPILTGCPKPFYKTVEIKSLKVHLSDLCGFNGGWARKNEICVESWMEDGRIIPDFEKFGHEMTHILHHINYNVGSEHFRERDREFPK